MNIDYNPELDILTIDRDEEYGCSRMEGDFIIDFTPSGEVRGVEVQNISRILDCSKEELEGISGARISTSGETTRTVTVHIDMGTEKTFAAQLSDVPAVTL